MHYDHVPVKRSSRASVQTPTQRLDAPFNRKGVRWSSPCCFPNRRRPADGHTRGTAILTGSRGIGLVELESTLAPSPSPPEASGGRICLPCQNFPSCSFETICRPVGATAPIGQFYPGPKGNTTRRRILSILTVDTTAGPAYHSLDPRRALVSPPLWVRRPRNRLKIQ